MQDLPIRIISRLDIKGENVIKGIQSSFNVVFLHRRAVNQRFELLLVMFFVVL